MTDAIVDTSVLIARETGRPIRASRLPDRLAASIITIGELRAGVLAATDVATRDRRLATLVDTLEVDAIPIDGNVAEAWARLRQDLRDRDLRIAVNDSWIAATARRGPHRGTRRPEVEALLRDPDAACAATAVNVAETLDVLVRHMGFDPDDVEEKLRWLTFGGLAIVAVEEAIGIAAGRLHAVHYQRTRRPLSLAVCVALAAALVRSEPTSDPAMAATARDVGVSVIGLRDSQGARP